jgi:hypothetical protein
MTTAESDGSQSPPNKNYKFLVDDDDDNDIDGNVSGAESIDEIDLKNEVDIQLPMIEVCYDIFQSCV